MILSDESYERMRAEGGGAIVACPERAYRTVPAPEQMHWETHWPIPAPEVVRAALAKPLRGLWIDHVPNGAELAALNVRLRYGDADAGKCPLASGDWAVYRWTWALGHPEEMGKQMAMPDAWFDHPQARKPPKALSFDDPRSGRIVTWIAERALNAEAAKLARERLPTLWREGLLRAAELRQLAHAVIQSAMIENLCRPDMGMWYQMILDEGWTMRRAAQVLREAGVAHGPICAWTNRWARPPAGAPAPGTAPAETAEEILARCEGQLADGGPWPLSQTAEIAAAHRYLRVE